MRRSFARDVYVNVLANLVAAAIIYLLGVAVGWFPANGWVLSISGATVGGVGILVVVIDSLIGERIDSLISLVLFGIGGGALGPALLFFGAHVDEKWIAILLFIFGGIFSVMALNALGPIAWAIHKAVTDSES